MVTMYSKDESNVPTITSVSATSGALTEVMVGTLLSSLLYIVTIRSCYSVIVIIDKNSSLSSGNKDYLKSIFGELHLNVIYQDEDFSTDGEQNFKFLSSSKSSGSPHALLMDQTMYIEAESLLIDVQEIADINLLPNDLTFTKIPAAS